MNRLEALTCAKNPAFPELNEDRMVLVPGHGFAVIDGATDISGLRHDDRLGRQATGGRLAAAAIAEAFAAWWSPPARDLPRPAEVAAVAGAAVAAVYERLGIAEQVAQHPERRFRAGFVAAVFTQEAVRLVSVGDCGVRVDGRPVLANVFPGDVVLSSLRGHAWRALARRGASAEEARRLSRQLIVDGISGIGALALGATEREALLAAVRREPRVAAAVDVDGRLLEMIIEAGLSGIRKAPESFRAIAIDGVSDVSDAVRSVDLGRPDFATIELFSDGYPSLPEAVGVEAWEEALARVDAVDPDRIGQFPGTKGRVEGSFGDDRSLVIIRNRI